MQTSDFCKNMLTLVITNHLGYAIMMSIYTSIIINLLRTSIHSKYKVLTRKWCDAYHYTCISFFLYISFQFMLPSLPLWKTCKKTKSIIHVHVYGNAFIIYLKSISANRTDTKKISPKLETENILTYVDDRTIPLHYQGNKST